MLDFVRKLLGDESGATAIEYGLLLGVIAMSLFFGMSTFTNQLNSVWMDIVAHSPTTVK
jgi:pilus assembly protein Flp/PilA